jgi:hypothetical protein
MPFNGKRNPRGVEVLNPQKLYSYFACGLPVVSSEWAEIVRLQSPARLCASPEQFVEGLRRAVAEPSDPETYRRYAAGFDWQQRVTLLLEELGQVELAAA